MIFVTIYALFSAIGFVVDLANHQWVAMFCVAVYSAVAYSGGNELREVFTAKTFGRKFGRAVIGLLLIAFAFYLSRHPMHLVYATIDGHLWVIIGIVLGVFAEINLRRTAP